MTTGEMIKQARVAKNMSQEELANMLGVSRQAVSKWESDKSVPIGVNRECINSILELSLSLEDGEIASSTNKYKILMIASWLLSAVLLVLLGISLIYIFTRLSDNQVSVEGTEKKTEMILEQQIQSDLCDKFQMDRDLVYVDIITSEDTYEKVSIAILNGEEELSADIEKKIKEYVADNYGILYKNITIISE